LSRTELRSFSNMVHALYAAIGSEMPCNEEWYFTPRDARVTVPWHILLKWRLNVPAGFEGNTEIYINTLEPWALRDKMVLALLEAREKGKVDSIRIGEQCRIKPNCLEYCHKKG
jgi:galactose-1-phosphate uridylyltransferase